MTSDLAHTTDAADGEVSAESVPQVGAPSHLGPRFREAPAVALDRLNFAASFSLGCACDDELWACEEGGVSPRNHPTTLVACLFLLPSVPCSKISCNRGPLNSGLDSFGLPSRAAQCRAFSCLIWCEFIGLAGVPVPYFGSWRPIIENADLYFDA